MIKLDEKYRLQNNTIHGIELVFEEKRFKNTKEGAKEYNHVTTLYYPNPLLAIRKWMELTQRKDVESLSDLVEQTKKQNDILEKIYTIFKNNNWKL